MHLDDEQLQRLLHGELTPQTERSAREHVATCADCRRRLTDAEREENEVYALLGAVDDPPPRIRADALAAIAEAAAADARVRDFAWLRRAAAILLVVGIAGAAYAIPGSPVHGWIHAMVQKLGGGPGVAPAPGDAPSGFSGIAVLPGEKLLILFNVAPGGGQVLVSLTGGSEVQVRAPTGSATFTSSVDQLLIDNHGSSATFEVRIPSSAPWVEIRVGGDRVFLKEGARVTTSGATSAVGGYSLRLTPP